RIRPLVTVDAESVGAVDERLWPLVLAVAVAARLAGARVPLRAPVSRDRRVAVRSLALLVGDRPERRRMAGPASVRDVGVHGRDTTDDEPVLLVVVPARDGGEPECQAEDGGHERGREHRWPEGAARDAPPDTLLHRARRRA